MTVSLQNFDPRIAAIIQDNTLRRGYEERLYPNLIYRDDAAMEIWQARVGDVQIFTRTGTLGVVETPNIPGRDPVPGSYSIEQYRAEASQLDGTLDTNLATSYAAGPGSTFMLDAKKLAEQAGQSVNRRARNHLFNAYLSGDTVAITAASSGAMQIMVASINGFTERLVGGQLVGVSTANPIGISFTGTAPPDDNMVTGAIPLDNNQPLGPGVLTLATGLSAALVRRDGVKSEFRPEIFRVGAAATVDGLTSASRLTLQDIVNAVGSMRSDNVPTHEDGYYHCHIPPAGETQIFSDEVYQRLNQSLPDDTRYHEMIIGDLVGCRFYRNREAPNRTNTGSLVSTGGGVGTSDAVGSPSLGGEVVNDDGVNINRTIITGATALREHWIPEGQAYVSEAGVQGVIKGFTETNHGVEINTNHIRYVIRAPQDRKQEVVSQTWSWSGDFVPPTDRTTGGPAAYKRARVIEHA